MVSNYERLFLPLENLVSSELKMVNEEFWNSLPTHQQDDASHLIRDVMVKQDAEYQKLKDEWCSFVMSFQKTG